MFTCKYIFYKTKNCFFFFSQKVLTMIEWIKWDLTHFLQNPIEDKYKLNLANPLAFTVRYFFSQYFIMCARIRYFS